MESEAGDLPQPSLGPSPLTPGSGWFSASQGVLSIAPCLTRSPAGQAPRLEPLPPLQSEITVVEHKADTNYKHSAGSQQLRWASLFPRPSSIFFFFRESSSNASPPFKAGKLETGTPGDAPARPQVLCSVQCGTAGAGQGTVTFCPWGWDGGIHPT